MADTFPERPYSERLSCPNCGSRRLKRIWITTPEGRISRLPRYPENNKCRACGWVWEGD
jgi:rubredoxin